jgi:hypothetical protein
MDPLRGEYGFLTDFSIDTEQARRRVRDMNAKFGIVEFQFYDAFEGYSGPPDYGKTEWYNHCSVRIHDNAAKPVKAAVLRAYISEIEKIGGRSWLYIQAAGCQTGDFESDPRVSKGGSHAGFFDKVRPDAVWAALVARRWAEFAKLHAFSGIHWDTIGNFEPRAAGSWREDDTYAALFDFLVATKTILQEHGLGQTCNFVDGQGWRPEMFGAQVGWQGNVVAFPYWEVWTVASKEDSFFANFGRAAGGGAVFVCYPGKPGHMKDDGSCETQNCNAVGLHPFDLGTLRWLKAKAEGCAYLMIGDGLQHVQTEYFPDVQGMSPEDVVKLQAALGRC